MLILYRDNGYNMKKRIALCLVFILMMGMTMQANAASGTLSDCVLSISCASNGVRVSFSEEATTKADTIGCKEIVLEEKTGPFSWRQIDIQGGYSTNSMEYGGSATYTGAQKGKTYRATCVHYAVFGSQTVTLKGSTGEMVYN